MSATTPPPRPRTARRARWGFAAQAVGLAVLLVLLFRLLDAEQVRLAFASVSLVSFLTFAVLMLAIRALTAWRWLLVARDHVGLERLDFVYLLRAELLADFANIWLQSLIGGEAVRVWKVVQRSGERKLGPASVVLDRLVGTASLGLACLPLVLVLFLQAPSLRLPEELGVDLRLVAVLGLAALLAAALALRYVEALRKLAKRALESATRSRFMAVPLAVSLAAYPIMAAAHYLSVPELAERSWLVAAMVAILPRLGRAIPLTVFGVTAVEGAVFAIGALLEISPQTILVVVALNLTVRYLGSIVGALAEMSLHGTRFLRNLRRPDLGT